MKRHRLPPHIAWPMFIVGLLSMSVATVVITVVAARSDGGPQVIDDYYQKAVNWDETAALQAASDALGWQADIVIPSSPGNATASPVEIILLDREGQPITDAQGTIRASRPHRADVVAERPLTVTETPGLYREAFPINQAGLWDFEIIAVQDSLRFQTVIRKEIAP